MGSKLEVLFSRLGNKDLSAVEIQRLVRDISHIIRDDKTSHVTTVNNKLVNLGWPREIIDEFTFELIKSLLDSETILEPNRNTIE